MLTGTMARPLAADDVQSVNLKFQPSCTQALAGAMINTPKKKRDERDAKSGSLGRPWIAPTDSTQGAYFKRDSTSHWLLGARDKRQDEAGQEYTLAAGRRCSRMEWARRAPWK